MSSKPPKVYNPQLGALGLTYSSTDANTAIETHIKKLFSELSLLEFPRDESRIIDILGSIQSASADAVPPAMTSIGPHSGHGMQTLVGNNHYRDVRRCVKTGLQNPIRGEGNNEYNFFQVLALKKPELAFSLLSVDEERQSNLLQSLSNLRLDLQKEILRNPSFWISLPSNQNLPQIAIREFVRLFAAEDPQTIFEQSIISYEKIIGDSYRKTRFESLLNEIKKAQGSVASVSVSPAATPALTPKSQTSSTDSINTNRTVPVRPPSRTPSAAVQTTTRQQNTLAVPVEPRKPIMRKQVQSPIEDQCEQGLRAVLDKLIEHKYELHGGSNNLDKNTKKQLAGLGITPTLDKKFARGARKAIADITGCLVNKPDPDNSTPNEREQWRESAINTLRTIEKILTARTEASSGFFGRGARSQSTIKLYLDIINMTREASTRLDNQSDNTRPIM